MPTDTIKPKTKKRRRKARKGYIKRNPLVILPIFGLVFLSAVMGNIWVEYNNTLKIINNSHYDISRVLQEQRAWEAKSPKERAIIYLQRAGYGEDVVFEFLCTLWHENRGADEYAYNINRDGSLDFGLLQVNDWQPPRAFKDASMECKADVDCIMPIFIEHMNTVGNMNAWYGNRPCKF